MTRNPIFGHAAIYTFANLAVAVIPFLLLPVLTRVLDPAAYGLVAMFSMVVTFISIFVGVNVHGAVTVRYLDNSNFDIPKYVSSSLAILTISSALMLVLMFIIGDSLSELTAIPVSWLYVAVLFAFLQFVVQLILVLWQASKNPISYGAMRLSHALLDAGGSIVLVVILALSWQGRLSGMLAAWLCMASIAIFFLIRGGWLAKSIDIACVKDALSYGVPLIPHSVGGVLLGLTDRFIVNNILDVANTGIYVVAVQLGLIIGLVADSFNKAFAPWLMQNLVSISDDSKTKIVRFTYLYFLAIISLATLAAVLAPYALPFIIGPQFQAANQIIVFILFGNAFVGMYYMVTNYVFFSRRTGLLSALTITTGVIMVLLTSYLTYLYGIKGAAAGFMLGQASLFLGAWILANHCVPMPWIKAVRPWRTL